MTSKALHVLIVDDSENDARLILSELKRGGWTVSHTRVDTRDDMTTALAKLQWDVIVADYSMPQFSGFEALELARAKSADIPFILISGNVGEETAVAAMKAGANDYLFKGDLTRLVPAVERELREAVARRLARVTREQLDKRDAQLSEALRLARLGTWHFDLVNNEATWSAEACRILGCKDDCDVHGLEKFLSCIHPDDRALLTDAMASAEVTQIAFDCRIASPWAALFVHIRGDIVRDAKGVVIEARGMIQDISEQKANQEELHRLKDAAEAANRAKSEFLANMSHEIRTPMTAIVGFADMMVRRGADAPDHEECVQVIRRNAWHLLELINEILDLSKIEAGQMTVEKRRCDLHELLSEISSVMGARAEEKSLRFNVKFEDAIPRYIYTDSLRLRQILVNLLGNAIKFTTLGAVDVLVNWEPTGTVADADQSSCLRIRVCDTGIGMTAEQLGRLFEPFMQGEQSITRKFGGTGLGLTISRRLARLLGGDVEATSDLGLGSMFEFWIDSGPISEADLAAGLPGASAADEAADEASEEIIISARVLLAEDGRDNQRLLTAHLEMAGAEVVVAENGRIAVQLCDEEEFDIILMDMQMPVMDGYSATTELRRRGVATPIIALTAYAMADDRSKCIAAGCTDYLTKPVDSELLLRTISDCLGSAVATRKARCERTPAWSRVACNTE